MYFFFNKFNECVRIDFPVYMYEVSDRVDFSEIVVITLIKKRC